MIQRVDWFISGDDGEDTFHERWKDGVRVCQSTNIPDINIPSDDECLESKNNEV